MIGVHKVQTSAVTKCARRRVYEQLWEIKCAIIKGIPVMSLHGLFALFSNCFCTTNKACCCHLRRNSTVIIGPCTSFTVEAMGGHFTLGKVRSSIALLFSR